MMLKEAIKLITPPVFIHLAKRLRGKGLMGAYYGLSGDYRSWDEAMAASTGYDSEIILEKTRTALLKVKNGEAVYERDSVLFDEIEYAWPLLTGLMWVAAKSGGKLNVLDFGGSLGSTYFQNRCFLRHLSYVRWNIVEQPQHVKTGKECFEDKQLRFYPTIKHCLAENELNVVILGGVLQYLEHPFEVLDELLRLRCDHIIIDRTPFWDGPTDRLCIQNVPPTIYPASYPSWIFSRHNFLNQISEKGFEVFMEFDDQDSLDGPVDLIDKGMIIVQSLAKV
jgi:hypothetical protein